MIYNTISKRHSDALFRLIKSLGKAEKRALALEMEKTGHGNKKYALLYRALVNMKHYNETALIEKCPDIKPAQVPNLKRNLYRFILNTLSDFHAARTPEIRIMKQMEGAWILFNKGLYMDAELELKKSKNMAHALDRKGYAIALSRLEKLLLRQNPIGMDLEVLNALSKRESDLLEQIREETRFKDLYLLLNARYREQGFISDKTGYEKIKEHILKKLGKLPIRESGPVARIYYLKCHISFALFSQDFKMAFDYSKKLVSLFNAEKDSIKKFPELYLGALNHALVSCHKLGRLADFNHFYSLLLRFSRNPGLIKNENLEILVFRYKYLHKINHHFLTGEFTRGIKIIKPAENMLERWAGRMNPHDALLFYYKLACLYFGAGHFRKSLKWLGKITGDYPPEFRQDLQAFARILTLICYYEQNDFRGMEYMLRSTYRFLAKKSEMHSFFNQIAATLRKFLSKDANPKKLKSHFETLHSRLKPLSRKPYQSKPFLYFDILSWLEGKIKNRTVEEIIQEKAAEKLKGEFSRKKRL